MSARRDYLDLFFSPHQILQEKADLRMPRSFLVKKYFSNKKPCYRESHLESQSGKSDLELGCLLGSLPCGREVDCSCQSACPGKWTTGRAKQGLVFLATRPPKMPTSLAILDYVHCDADPPDTCFLCVASFCS